ncbi:MAG: universal stress protein [Waterburya sp.]
MFNRILVAIDSSPTSRNVFEASLSLAKTTGSSVMLLHILSYNSDLRVRLNKMH